MTRKLSVITAVGVAALSFGAPAAFGGVHAGGEAAPVLAQPDPMIEDGFAQAVAQVSMIGNRDAHERGIVPNQGVGDLNTYTFDKRGDPSVRRSGRPGRRGGEARTSKTNGYSTRTAYARHPARPSTL